MNMRSEKEIRKKLNRLRQIDDWLWIELEEGLSGDVISYMRALEWVLGEEKED